MVDVYPVPALSIVTVLTWSPTRVAVAVAVTYPLPSGGGLKPVHSYQVIITGGKAALDGSMAGDAIGRVIGLTLPAAGKFFSGQNIKKQIVNAKKISSMMFHDMEVDGELDDKTINNIEFNSNYSLWTYTQNM